MNFTAQQQQAIDVSGPPLDACVVAGPGSGKTTVLVEYFRRLVAHGTDPLRILAITFTERAAGNMRERLAKAFQEDPVLRGRLERAWVSTIHGFCARLVRENAVFAGVDPEFYVADARESWRLQQESMAAAMEEVFRDCRAEISALIRGLSSYEFEEALLSAYDAMRSAGTGVEELAAFPRPAGTGAAEIAQTLRALGREAFSGWSFSQKQQARGAIDPAERIVSASGPREALEAVSAFSCSLNQCKRGNRAYDLLKRLRELVDDCRYSFITELYEGERRLLIDIMRRFDRLYRERKRRAGALDFSDLEEFAVRLLEGHSETRERVRDQFDHILMDEFQDTNGQQSRLMRLVRAPDRFYAVGDINQSIFGFRHAEPEGFAEYRAESQRAGRRLVELTDNFRSRPDILSAVETVLEGEAGVERRSLIAGRQFEEELEVSVEAAYAPDEDTEARWVAQRILDLAGGRFRDVAVLVRNTEVLSTFTEVFEAFGIPHLVNHGKGFYAGREVNDLTHLLRTIANPRDEMSLAVVLRSPLVEVSDEALARLKLSGENMGAALMGLDDAKLCEFDQEDAQRLAAFRDRLREWRARREYVTFDRLLVAAIDDCGYPSGPNVDKFLGQARAAAQGRSLDEFIDELALVRDLDPREPDAPPEDSANAVKVMTVHSAKGLEFPIVFVAALHKGVETKLPVVAFSRNLGLGARWRMPGTRTDKDDLWQHAIREERKRREEEESRRLLYVAMTRAEERLILTFSGESPKNWAELVRRKLGLELEGERDEVVVRAAPDAREWNLRMVSLRALGQGARAAAGLAPGSTEHKRRWSVPLAPQSGTAKASVDSNATVTALTTFANCPRRYFLGNYLGFEGKVRGEESGGIPAAELGTQVHKLLAGATVPNAAPEALRLADTFRNSPLGLRLARATRIEREFDFLMALEGLVIRGQVDLWFEEGGELVIVDYKTDVISARQARERAREYEFQLRLYALAIECAAGRPADHTWLYFLRPNMAVEVDLTPSLLDSPEQMIREFLDAQASFEFPLREGEQCRRCPFFKGLCPAARLADDLQES
jgi:ATP-dependent exoDNAse (exonuclease V) beta subunit